MSDFIREDRYVVIKRSDLAAAKATYLTKSFRALHRVCEWIDNIRRHMGKKPIECVVIESTWPEYEHVWNAIEYRMETGRCLFDEKVRPVTEAGEVTDMLEGIDVIRESSPVFAENLSQFVKRLIRECNSEIATATHSPD